MNIPDRFDELERAVHAWFQLQGWSQAIRPPSSAAFNREYQAFTTSTASADYPCG